MALTAQEVDTSKTSARRKRLDEIKMALEALRNVIKNAPGRCAVCKTEARSNKSESLNSHQLSTKF